jgi:hypothetical protein
VGSGEAPLRRPSNDARYGRGTAEINLARPAAADYLLLFGDPMMAGLTFLFIEG